MTKFLSIKEHKPFTEASNYQEIFEGKEELLKIFPSESNSKGEHLLGCYVEGWPNPTPKARFYVGITWLIEDEVALQVCPKIKNIDYLKMFMTCLKNKENDIQNKLMKIYGIDFKKKMIDSEGLNIEVTPFIIIHFLSLLEPIVRKGLKHNYVFEEENLQSKLKGKLTFSQHFKKNILNNRLDKNYCRYQEYSADCIENRILKKALIFAEKYIQRYNFKISKDQKQTIQKAKTLFADISDKCNQAEIERFRINPLFKEYSRAISVAKTILRRFGYDIQATEKNSKKVPPFWIDMSLLFETYVLGLLKEKYGNNIKYHISTYGNEIDFGKPDEKLIIDTKYIYKWDSKDNHDNIRQLSGYARNKSIREKLTGEDNETDIFPCLIIYPSFEGIDKFSKDKIMDEPQKAIEHYIKFYKLGVKLPNVE